MSTCTSCGAAIRFEQSAKPPHKWMILNPLPYEDGNVVIFRGYAHVFKDAAAALEAFPGSQLWVDHHATCEHGKQWSEYTAGKGPRPAQMTLGGEP
jgi:hypothetical protein